MSELDGLDQRITTALRQVRIEDVEFICDDCGHEGTTAVILHKPKEIDVLLGRIKQQELVISSLFEIFDAAIEQGAFPEESEADLSKMAKLCSSLRVGWAKQDKKSAWLRES